MALINCSECGKEISDKAAVCPNCGNPMSVQGASNVHNEQEIKCPKCGSDNVAISFIEIGGVSQGQLKATSANKYKHTEASINITAKKAVCSNCGNDWTLTDEKAHKSYQGMISVFVIVIALLFLFIATTGGNFDKERVSMFVGSAGICGGATSFLALIVCLIMRKKIKAPLICLIASILLFILSGVLILA